MSNRTRRSLLLLAAAFVVGLGGGVLFQEYYGVGRLFVLLNAAERPAAVDGREDRVEVEREVLAGKRVIVALVIGQSNAGNSGESAVDAGDGVYAFHEGRIYTARDPLPGATGSGGTVWTRLGPKLLERGVADAVVFAPVVVGGTPIERWAPGGDLHPTILSAVDALFRAGLPPTHILWHQGESDADRDTPADRYVERFQSILQALRERGADAPAYVALATHCRLHRPDPAIRQAQRALVDATAGVFAGPDTDQLGYAYRYDGCHFTDEGLEAHADLWLAALEQH
jgi:hypothetical protein